MNKKRLQLNERAKQLACSEILSPTFGTTQQFFEVHQPIFIDGVPSIARIDTERDKDNIYVYFPIDGEPYFWVVRLEIVDEDIKIAWCWDEPKVHAYLLVVTDRYSLEEITKMIGLKPTRTERMGQIRQRSKNAAKENTWVFEPYKDLPDELERKLQTLLDYLLPHKQAIRQLASQCYCAIHLAYYAYSGYGSLRGCHFDALFIQQINDLGVEMDFDLYAWGPKLK